ANASSNPSISRCASALNSAGSLRNPKVRKYSTCCGVNLNPSAVASSRVAACAIVIVTSLQTRSGVVQSCKAESLAVFGKTGRDPLLGDAEIRRLVRVPPVLVLGVVADVSAQPLVVAVGPAEAEIRIDGFDAPNRIRDQPVVVNVADAS